MSATKSPDDAGLDVEPDGWVLDALSEALLRRSATPAARDRLLALTRELPLRYAPFFDRLAGLWSLPLEQVEGALSVAADPAKWRTALPGLRYFNVAERTPAGLARLLRFTPGFRLPEHRHGGEESVLVLEGSYTDTSGDVVRAGELRRLAAGSAHGLSVDPGGPCVAAILQPELDFLTPLGGRLLAKFSLRRRRS